MMDSDEEVPTLIEQSDKGEIVLDGRVVPLTIICGFLGAGKSTLLKRILTEYHGYRIAVIMNEFGDTAVGFTTNVPCVLSDQADGRILKTINVSSADDPTAENSEEFLELANGCLCCSIKDSGIAAIEKLMQRKGAFDHILLETTGLADPGPIASMFWHNEEYAMGLGKDIRLDGIICVVDCVFGKKQMEDDSEVEGGGESLRQVASADVVLLNKVDLVSERQIISTERLIGQVNPAVPIHRTIQGQVDLSLVIGIAAYQSAPQLQRNYSVHDHHINDGHHHDGSTTHFESRGISSLQVSCPILSAEKLEKLDEWIRTVLWENHLPKGSHNSQDLRVLRCKGLFTAASGEQYVLQGVQNLYEISRMDEKDATGIPESGKLVLIGKGLDESVRRSLLEVFE